MLSSFRLSGGCLAAVAITALTVEWSSSAQPRRHGQVQILPRFGRDSGRRTGLARPPRVPVERHSKPASDGALDGAAIATSVRDDQLVSVTAVKDELERKLEIAADLEKLALTDRHPDPPETEQSVSAHIYRELVGYLRARLLWRSAGHAMLDGVPYYERERHPTPCKAFELNTSAAALFTDGGAGLGHRSMRNAGVFALAYRHGRPVKMYWLFASWNAVYRDNALASYGGARGKMPNAKKGGAELELDVYANSGPAALDGAWNVFRCDNDKDTQDTKGHHAQELHPNNRLAAQARTLYNHQTVTNCGAYSSPDSLCAQKLLKENLSDKVEARLEHLRRQYRPVHMCAHFRFGNNETGDWEKKAWRHTAHPDIVMTDVVAAMAKYTVVSGAAACNVSVFVASDTPTVVAFFRDHIPDSWQMVTQKPSEVKAPEGGGVLFGQGKHHMIDTEETQETAMQETAADMYGLSECNALFVTTYSSFVGVPIMLTTQRDEDVYLYDGEAHQFSRFSDANVDVSVADAWLR